jgi:hypothetical protein
MKREKSLKIHLFKNIAHFNFFHLVGVLGFWGFGVVGSAVRVLWELGSFIGARDVLFPCGACPPCAARRA